MKYVPPISPILSEKFSFTNFSTTLYSHASTGRRS
jgi:hypothetical protein